ncbi:AAA family ATPase [Methylobacterium sp. WL7]|uniref:ATP-dependent nuclease n=1 Tax=Methylobacterium sp. WL7 TaxID=2603900 RepID=UPI0011C96E17|nr:AAA family ATPase [Methylobacterium sp. WL7]TXN39496.1 AAA family ATPase [Methylobacterium sp. WL7]
MSEQRYAGVYVNNLEFHGGAILSLKDNSIVVLVGPNNSGKSLSLKEIERLIESGPCDTKSIKSLTIQRVGDDGLLAKTVAPYRSKKDGYFYWGDSEYHHTSLRDVENGWKQDAQKLGPLTGVFVSLLNTETRLADSNPVQAFDSIKLRSGSHPIHGLYSDSDKEVEVSGLFRQFFGLDLVIHRSPGRTIPLYVGIRPTLEGSETVTSRTYLDKVEELETLETQGDGFRSFTSIVLRVWTGSHSVLLVDEPEAFLHPPQARAVGEIISSGSDYQKQVFISTHSNDVIQGLLSKFPDRVSVVRLDRSGEYCRATYLSNERIAELWKDPILRYSNVLNGLFHNQVVVTEADGDCRFYEALADAQSITGKSTFYTYAGGKDRIAVIVRALTALHVPVRAVVDIDIFASDNALKGIIEASGRDWEEYRRAVSNIRTVIQSKKSWLLGAGFKDRVQAILAEIRDNEIVPKEKLTALSVIMREASPWDAIKDAGINAVPSGDPAKQLTNLLGSLRRADVFVVPVGQMERFCKSIGGHGPQWVGEVLKRDLVNDEELKEARSFVSDLVLFNDLDEKISVSVWSKQKRLLLSPKEVSIQSFNMAIKTIGNLARTAFFTVLIIYYGFQLLDYIVTLASKK